MKHYSYYPGVLQFEISSNCNAQCPGCARNLFVPSDDPDVNTDITNIQIITHPDIPKNVYLDLEVFKGIFSDRVKQKLGFIEFIGSIDDPLMHPQFLEMLEFITNSVPGVRTVIHSNASLRTPEYFTEMAKILKGSSHKFAFSIDGLEDTNHLYRRNTKWNKIIENARAFISAGGNASWQYLIFPWNQHQVDDAKSMAKEMGFTDFRARNNRGLNLDFKGEARRSLRDVNFKTAQTYFDPLAKESEIDCVMRPRGMYFINYEGNVWPCCFLNNQFYTKYGVLDENYQRFEGNYGKNWNNLYHHTFDEILDDRFYTDDLTDSWDTKTHGPGAKDRVMKCTGTCSKKSLEKIPFVAHTITELKKT
jgi:MoaA/NifB/PqqE/SkfB family radical SAM enzyme